MAQGDIDWSRVKRVLIVRLRSIGDTVLTTPSLIALKRFAPDVEVDVLLEDWVAPVLEGFDAVDRVVTVGRGTSSRLRTAWGLRRRGYDVVFNLHGGTTATFFAFASGARYRVGYSEYQYSFLYNHLLTSSTDYWKTTPTHSAEQQLALLGSAGVRVDRDQKTRLAVTGDALAKIERKLSALEAGQQFALMHPVAAFATKTWAVENFARTAEVLASHGLQTVAVATRKEREILERLKSTSRSPIVTMDELSLPEITALASKARLFIGNDSGIAHMAAAVGIPSVVIFGSSNRDHWHPWTNAPYEVVFEPFACQPCPGYECKEFGEPRCILELRPQAVFDAIGRVLERSKDEVVASSL